MNGKKIFTTLKKPMCLISNEIHLGQQLYGVNLGARMLTENNNKIPVYQGCLPQTEKHFNTYKSFPDIYNRTMLDVHNIYNKNLELQNGFHLPFNLGGDHSISIGSVQASLKTYQDLVKVIWIDAHADIHHIDSSTSKNLHGMPIGFLMNKMEQIPKWCKEYKLEPEQILYIGLRDVDEYELNFLKENNIDFISMQMLQNYSLKDLLEVLDDSELFPYIHLSIDVDSIDPLYFPSTGTPSPNGLNPEDILDIISFYHPQIVGMDLVEFNPHIGNKDDILQSFQIANSIIQHTYRLSSTLH